MAYVEFEFPNRAMYQRVAVWHMEKLAVLLVVLSATWIRQLLNSAWYRSRNRYIQEMRERKGGCSGQRKWKRNILVSAVAESCNLELNCINLPPAELGMISSCIAPILVITIMYFSVFPFFKQWTYITLYFKRTLIARKMFRICSQRWKAVFVCSGFQLALLWYVPKQIIGKADSSPTSEKGAPSSEWWNPSWENHMHPATISPNGSCMLILRLPVSHTKWNPVKRLFPKQAAISKCWVCHKRWP